MEGVPFRENFIRSAGIPLDIPCIDREHVSEHDGNSTDDAKDIGFIFARESIRLQDGICSMID